MNAPTPIEPAGAGDPAPLDFEPVVRKVKRPDGWTPELQREFIALLAQSGSPQAACTAMDKHVSGIEALYKVPSAGSFRAAWDQAVATGRRAQGLDCGPPHLGPVPGIQRRKPRDAVPPPEPEPDPDADAEAEAMGDDAKFELLQRLVAKFAAKVGQERNARLSGEIVAADFYLRQVTCLEVAFELMAIGKGMDAWEEIVRFRRGGHNILEIADTDMSRILDGARRDQWAAMGEPARPEHPAPLTLADHGTHRTQPLQCVGRASAAPPGVDPVEWSEMDMAEQRRTLAAIHAAQAAAQVSWEAAQRREYEERGSTEGKTNDGETDASA